MSHHISSFEHYVHYQIPAMIKESSPIRVVIEPMQQVHVIHFENTKIGRPTTKLPNGFLAWLTPSDAIKQRETYMFDVFVDLRHEVYLKDSPSSFKLSSVHIYNNLLFFKAPCMRNSSVCNEQMPSMRCPGTFIIHGFKKCIINQFFIRSNYDFVTRGKNYFQSEIRCHHANKLRSTSTLIIKMSGHDTNQIPTITIKVPFLNVKIPFQLIYKVYGVDDIMNHIATPDMSVNFRYILGFMLSVNPANYKRKSKSDILDWIGRQGSTIGQPEKRQKHVHDMLRNEFLPHVTDKMFLLSRMLRKLIRLYLGEICEDDVNSVENLRPESTGTLLALLTRQLLRKYIKEIHSSIFDYINKVGIHNKKLGIPVSHHCLNVLHIFNWKQITNGLKYAMSTGNWGVQRGAGNQTGVCQVINTTNIFASLSLLRQFNTPVNRDGKMINLRQCHLTQFGTICCCETPEGNAVGLNVNKAFFTQLRIDIQSQFIIQIIQDCFELSDQGNLVCVNGIPIGLTMNPQDFVCQFNTYRRWYDIPIECSIVYKDQRIDIYSDRDDTYRPFLVGTRLHHLQRVYSLYGMIPHMFWQQLLIDGILVYMNKSEELHASIAIDLKTYQSNPTLYTYMEIHPSFTSFGCSAGSIPFANHNQAPRNIYQSAMIKQAISAQQLDFHNHIENKTYNLIYPQKPLVETWINELVGGSQQPCGQSVILAIQVSNGYNQEDAVVVNRASLERGLFGTTIHNSYKDSEKDHGKDVEKFGVPADLDKLVNRSCGNYAKLGPSGFVPVGTPLEKGDIIIGKYMDFKQGSQKLICDRSTQLQTQEKCVVRDVLETTTRDNRRAVMVRTTSLRFPEVGDKLSSRHGQKGIIGHIMNPEDIPWMTNGMRPDLFMSTHGISSRMTIGHIMEMFTGMIAAVEGKIFDGTPFKSDTTTIQDLKQFLTQNGLPGFSRHQLYSGENGKPLRGQVFIGIITYQRLRHMVQDKIHARSTGRNQNQTRQPVHGRSRGGGLRMGEMERDAMISHGATAIIQDRLLDCSDKFDTVICKTCGFIAESQCPPKDKFNYLHRKPYCRHCNSHSNIAQVSIPYAFKTLWQELLACHIFLKFEFE